MTGSSACDLVNYLISLQLNIVVVTLKSNYGGGGNPKSCDGQTVYRLSGIYNGKNKYFRLFSSIIENWILVRKALSLKPRLIISLTDPPLLNFWVSYFSKKRRIYWVYWAMDLYPEAFIAANLVSRNNFIYRIINSNLKKNRPYGLISLGPNQQFYLEDYFGKIDNKVVLHCGIQKNITETTILPFWKCNFKLVIGYVGNIGEAHDERFVMSIIDSIDPEKQHFILSVYGSKSKCLIDYAIGKPGVDIVSSIPAEELTCIDIHVVSLLKLWDHVCVPSKAFTAVSLGCPLLLNCSKKSDVYGCLIDASWHFDIYNQNTLKSFFSGITSKDIITKRNAAFNISKNLVSFNDSSLKDIYNLLEKCD